MATTWNRAKRLLLGSARVATLAGPLGIAIADAQLSGAPPKPTSLAFEVASVKPHEFARNEFAFASASRESRIRISGNRVTIQGLFAGLVLAAYQLRTFQLEGVPDWHNDAGRSQLYDIEARTPGDAPPALADVRRMLQTLLAERFQLKFHRETKELPAYHLVVANHGAKLKPAKADGESRSVSTGRMQMNYTNFSISDLVLQIGPQFDRPLFDKTGLPGGYDFSLEYMPALPSSLSVSPEEAAALAGLYPPDAAPPLLVALQQQLGLKIVPARERVEILVIDRVERPSAN